MINNPNPRNKKLKARAEHTLCVWIQRPGRISNEKGRQAKDRFYFTVFVYIPRLAGAVNKYLIYGKKGRFASIAKVLHDNGYEVIAEDVNYNFTDEAWINFYRIIGLVRK